MKKDKQNLAIYKMKLLIVTECEHFRKGNTVYAPRHFVKEIMQWSRAFKSIELIARFPPWSEPADLIPYRASNIIFRVGNCAFKSGRWEFIRSLGRTVVAAVSIFRGFIFADAVHLRCPSRHGLLCLLLWRLFRRPCYVKWAGNWEFHDDSPFSVRLQRWLILRMSGQVVVSVYSRTEGDPPHIFETVTTSLSKAEIKRALDSMNNSTHEDCRLLWVGRFTPNKNVSALFDTLLAVLRVFPNASLHLVGEGPGMKMAREEVERRGITEKIIFHGSQSWEILCSYYSAARLLLLPSFSEGFPKVVLEAALFGTPSIVFSVGALPKIVQDRGVAVKPPGDSAAFSRATIEILQDQKRWERLSNSARRWAEQICIESVVDGYLDLIEKAWGVRID